MRRLMSRLEALEKKVPTDKAVFFGWMRQEGTEITKASSGERQWAREESETEREFLSRVRKELEVTGPYPRFVIVS